MSDYKHPMKIRIAILEPMRHLFSMWLRAPRCLYIVGLRSIMSARRPATF